MQIILSCEHASNRIPPAFKKWFRGAEEVLSSHRGWDPGALELARAFEQRFPASDKISRGFQKQWQAPLFITNYSRLLIEPNRSISHPSLFSDYTRNLSADLKRQLLDEYYRPYRSDVESAIAAQIESGNRVLHLSLHSFVPELNGEVRRADIGLLYDPRRHLESEFCTKWKHALVQQLPEYKVRRNYPYRGFADGFTTALRKRFSADRYLGIELEVNQKHRHPLDRWQTKCKSIAETLPSPFTGKGAG